MLNTIADKNGIIYSDYVTIRSPKRPRINLNWSKPPAEATTTAISEVPRCWRFGATPALAAGASVTFNVDLRPAAQNGTHVLSATADSTNAGAESSEANNTASLTVNIRSN